MLSVRDAGGKVTRVAAGARDVAFNWSPTGDWLAFAYSEPGRPGLYQGVEVAHADGSDRRTLSQVPLVAFYWQVSEAARGELTAS